MREIKFRAWHTELKKMFSAEEMGADQVTLMPNGQGFINVSGDSTRLSHFLPQMIPMQFTGLHDRNGKEIWEGDIVKAGELGHLHRDSSYHSYSKVNPGDLFFVKKLKSGFTLMDIKTPSDCNIPNLHTNINNYNFWNGSKDLEVIGNIYESPELLIK